jgi:hypothetical protein
MKANSGGIHTLEWDGAEDWADAGLDVGARGLERRRGSALTLELGKPAVLHLADGDLA